MAKRYAAKEIVILILRLLVGSVFIFSAVVKGIDPLGTAYRVEDYLEAYGWYFLVDFSLWLAVALILLEFLLGISMFLRLRFRLASLGILLIMVFFTIVTYFDAKLNLVPDCGCFGDAIKLTNWETFYKNIVLVVIALVLFLWRKNAKQHLSLWIHYTILMFFLLVFSGFMYYNINHLPIVDFRSWKVGKDMKTIGEDKVKVYVSYKNKETGEIKEFLSPDYPWGDSAWLSKREFIGQRFDNSSLVKKHDLIIEDSLGNVFTKELIENPGTQVLIISPDLYTIDKQGLAKALALRWNIGDEVNIAVITGSSFDLAASVFKSYSNVEVYFADDILLKAMIRSNPGLVILKNGIIVQKLHFKDIPDKLEIN
jgi:uncharacterized membrane protein YphA (DoxX/SURF4 family)